VPFHAATTLAGISATDIAKMLGVTRATVYRYLSDGTTA
jgi:predicted transcriptional regulator